MISKAKIKQLEKKCDKAIYSKDQRLITRYISYHDRKPLNEHGFLLSKEEIRRLKSEDEEIRAGGGLVVYMTSYQKPKIRKAR